ncbi:MAG: radical SAM protein [Rhodocyclaceae bacterium]|nr:radical SAM protein [Rhodocyclaceae bacterium]
MKTSKYNLATENPATGELILFNTLYGSTVVVEPENRGDVLALLEKPHAILDGNDGLIRLRDELMRLKFVINSDTDELALLMNRKAAGINDRNRLDVILMPNLNCNFACPYCYESHDPAKKMSAEVRENLIRWLGKAIPKHKVVLLNWFGGEPLLSPDDILSITAFVRDKCKEHDVRLLTNITTNGYLFSPEIIRKLVLLELFSYQITVDGPPNTHNKTRILKSGKGTFDRVFANILALARADNRVRVSLRVNYNHNNIYQIPELLNMFPQDTRSQLRVVFEPVFGDPELSATKNMEGNEISRAITEYYDLAASLGYDVRLGGIGVGKLVYCYAERENQYIVDFKGDVFKCSVTDFASANRVGTIEAEGDFVRDESNWSDWFGLAPFDQNCQECTFLPLCMGGCRKDRIKNGATGSYCSLVPTNTSHALKSIAFGSFGEVLKREVEVSRCCAKGSQVDKVCG